MNKLNLGIFSGSKRASNFEPLKKELLKIADYLSPSLYNICYGGGTTGVMGVIPRRFHERGGDVTSIDAKMFADKFGKTPFGNVEVHEKFMDRQNGLLEKSDILLCLPGGIGTMSEMTTILTLNDVKAWDKKELILFNFDGFFDHFLNQINMQIETGYIHSMKKMGLHVVNNSKEFIDLFEGLTSPV